MHLMNGCVMSEYRLQPMVDFIKGAEILGHQFTRMPQVAHFRLSTDDATIIQEIENGTYTSTNFTFFYTR